MTLCQQTRAQVCTAQYFLWYFCLLPLVLPQSKLRLRWGGLAMCAAWFASQGHWLYWGYELEFLGNSVFLELWGASILFFVVNCWLLWALVRNHQYRPLFVQGKVARVLSK